jgi:GGDEF domain-containing protein
MLSVAMGAATKQSSDENIDDVINLADQRMYEDKKRIKGADTARTKEYRFQGGDTK